MPLRLDHVTFRIGDCEIAVAWDLAVEIRERCARDASFEARIVAQRISAVGATRAVIVRDEERAALVAVLERWQTDVAGGSELLRAAAGNPAPS